METVNKEIQKSWKTKAKEKSKFPNNLTQKWRVASLRFFTCIQQPKIWSSYVSRHNGVDPEVNEGNSTSDGITPSIRIITMGLNVKF